MNAETEAVLSFLRKPREIAKTTLGLSDEQALVLILLSLASDLAAHVSILGKDPKEVYEKLVEHTQEAVMVTLIENHTPSLNMRDLFDKKIISLLENDNEVFDEVTRAVAVSLVTTKKIQEEELKEKGIMAFSKEALELLLVLIPGIIAGSFLDADVALMSISALFVEEQMFPVFVGPMPDGHDSQTAVVEGITAFSRSKKELEDFLGELVSIQPDMDKTLKDFLVSKVVMGAVAGWLKTNVKEDFLVEVLPFIGLTASCGARLIGASEKNLPHIQELSQKVKGKYETSEDPVFYDMALKKILSFAPQNTQDTFMTELTLLSFMLGNAFSKFKTDGAKLPTLLGFMLAEGYHSDFGAKTEAVWM